jgi:hypothetical protein
MHPRRDSGDCLPKQEASRTLRGGGLFSHDGHMNSMVAMEVWGAINQRYEVMCDGLKGKET